MPTGIGTAPEGHIGEAVCPFFDTYGEYEMVDVQGMGLRAKQGHHLVDLYDEECDLFSCACGQSFHRSDAQIRIVS